MTNLGAKIGGLDHEKMSSQLSGLSWDREGNIFNRRKGACSIAQDLGGFEASIFLSDFQM